MYVKLLKEKQMKKGLKIAAIVVGVIIILMLLYDAVVENINGGLAKVAELLGRNEAELATAAVPAGTGDTSEEHEAFDMNDFL